MWLSGSRKEEGSRSLSGGAGARESILFTKIFWCISYEIHVTEPVHLFTIQDLLRKDWRDKLNSCCVWYGSKVSAQNLLCILKQIISECGLSMVWQSLIVWRENQGKAGVNLQDSRYQFRSALLECTREFARRAMAAGITKRNRSKQLDRMRNIVPHQTIVYCENLRNIRM